MTELIFLVELQSKTTNIKRQVEEPWGLCENPAAGEYFCERLIRCKGICGRWRIANWLSSEICGECQKVYPLLENSGKCGTCNFRFR
jgi:hypothetical protein